jgi:lipopolysaccharide export system permease protein
MLPISIYLTSRATKDRTLLDLDSLLTPIKRLMNVKQEDDDLGLTLLNAESVEYGKLKAYDDNKLIDLLKNYRQYDLDRSYRNTAIHILGSRGVTEQELRFGGNLKNEAYESALRYKRNYEENSKIGFLLYLVALVFDLSGAVLNNNGFPVLGKILLGIGVLATVLYLISFIKALISQSNFYKAIEKKVLANSIVLVIVGIPLYPIFYYYFKRKMKEDLKQIR